MLQIVKMMILIVVIFAVCWLPQHVYFVLASLYPDVTHYKLTQHVYIVIYWFAMSNAMYNPIIYCWMNARFVLVVCDVETVVFNLYGFCTRLTDQRNPSRPYLNLNYLSTMTVRRLRPTLCRTTNGAYRT